ncbi:hypothetical protein LRS05_11640 [Flavobacterium sp. J372]|uniref:hypothetical protein n=1 Tax=Flavobacterium sp. J372 TaxID=2898436 RepID=UPI002150EDB3|nr:hypothetical protein [Flavobacterium sp. J372]MCR5862751.1 hypothetical protein [Flavobacterium sp. J372]
MKQAFIAAISTLLLSCNDNKENPSTINSDSIESSSEFSIPQDVTYEIIDEKVNDVLRKTNIEIRLNKAVDENTLRNIAYVLKADREDLEKLWIFYYLPRHEVGNGAWATTHYSPDLEVKIIGASAEASDEMNNLKVTGEILNVWKDNDAMVPNKKYLVKEDGKLCMKTVYAKSSMTSAGELKEVVKETKVQGRLRYDYDNNHGEYYLIEKNGNLGYYSENGKFKELVKE